MKTMLALAAALTLTLAASSQAGTSVSIGVELGNAPPPPVVVYRSYPHWRYVPGPQVYVMKDEQLGYDYFRYGGMFYIYNNGWWYRAGSYRGPFVAIEPRFVPRPFFAMTEQQYRWRHHPEMVAVREHEETPPGWNHGKAKWKHHDDDDDQGHEHGHH
jgi:hypothetical protein